MLQQSNCVLFFTSRKTHKQENMHSISEFKELLQYSNIKKNSSFCTVNDKIYLLCFQRTNSCATKKIVKCNLLLKGFYKSSIIFASEQGRQTPKINKRWGRGAGVLIRSGVGRGGVESKLINVGGRLFGT